MSQPALEQRPEAASAAHDEPQYLSHRQILVVLFGLMAGVLLAADDITTDGLRSPRPPENA